MLDISIFFTVFVGYLDGEFSVRIDEKLRNLFKRFSFFLNRNQDSSAPEKPEILGGF